MAKTRESSTKVRRTTVAPMVLRAEEPSRDERAKLIAEEAYYRAEQRGFAPGGELEDWLAAESAVDARMVAPGKA